jgi:thiol-disulfide isomerase/thioredoxin
MKLCIFSSTLLALLVATAHAADPKLKICDPAPAVNVAKWFKGQEVPKFEHGQVYVVEFWATWCGPCKESIPHLTELAKAFDGKAHIIGVSIWESEKTDHEKRLAGVSKFVDQMGDKMVYSIAADDNDGSMAKSWMEAATETGIPTAFIVGKDGKIAWIGFPWGGLDKTLEQTVAGTLDANAVATEAAARQEAKDARAKQEAMLKPVTELQAQKKPQEAIAALDKLIAVHPEYASKTGFLRYRLLMAYDQPAAYAQVRELLNGDLNNNANGLYQIARDLIDPPGPKIKDWDLAFDVSQRAVKLSPSNPSYLATLAEAYAGKADYAKAMETMDLALRKAADDKSFPEGSTKYLTSRLESFKKAQQKAAPAA